MERAVALFAGGMLVGAISLIAAALGASSSGPEGVTDEMRKKYKFHTKLGSGAFGTVYLVQNGEGTFYAMKIIKNDSSSVMSEVKVMKELNHPNVTKLFDVKVDSKHVNLVMDYMRGGSLQDRLKTKKRLSQSTVRLYFLQLCEAIDYLHEMNITHRDLKPDNILLASDDERTLLKVSDFGLSKNHVQYYLTSDCGTKLFMAPEYWNIVTTRYSSKVDIWSLGVILYVCITGDYPFLSHLAVCTSQCKFDQSIWKSYPKAPIDIIKRMLTKNSTLRPEASDILDISWLKDDDLLCTYARIRGEF